LEQLWTADVILHAGDLLDLGVLEYLRELAPVHAVLGNNDHSLQGVLPPVLEVSLEGTRIGMVHDSGASTGRAKRLRRRFPDADVVVFGHSHSPLNQLGESGQLLFNPGSPTQRRRQAAHTLGLLDLADGAVVRSSIVELD
jgi:putative phosphoesterase